MASARIKSITSIGYLASEVSDWCGARLRADVAPADQALPYQLRELADCVEDLSHELRSVVADLGG